MKSEKSSGAVVYHELQSSVEYLLLQYNFKSKYWGFPRGKIEEKETEKETATREIEEETGLKPEFVEGFRESIKWMFRRDGALINKEAVFFLARSDTKEVELSEEHYGYDWVEYERAKDMIKHDNTLKVLEEAHQFLKEKLDFL